MEIKRASRFYKRRHLRGLQAKNALKGAPVLVFAKGRVDSNGLNESEPQRNPAQ